MRGGRGSISHVLENCSQDRSTQTQKSSEFLGSNPCDPRDSRFSEGRCIQRPSIRLSETRISSLSLREWFFDILKITLPVSFSHHRSPFGILHPILVKLLKLVLGGMDRRRLTLVALDARTGARQPALLCGRRMNGALPDGAVGNQVCAFWIAGTNDTDGFSPHPTL